MPQNSNHLSVLILALFLFGAVLFVIGTLMRRESGVQLIEAQEGQSASTASPEPELSLELRIDMIERLAIVGQPWCVDELEKFRRDDPDEMVREAADAALIVIAARG